MKRGYIQVLSIFVLMILILSFSAGAFSDVDDSTDEGKAIAEMRQHGYIQGFEDGTFRPKATLTRAEFVTIINKMYGYFAKAENIFNDVGESDWFYGEVLAAVQAGYIKGMGDGRFAPNETVSREQVCVMLDSILKPTETYYKPAITDAVSDWARGSVERLVSNYLFVLEDGGKFRAIEPITRGEVCVALEKCIVDVDFETVFEPIDLESMAQEELDKRLKTIVECMEKTVIPLYEDEDVIKVANMVVSSMKEYIKDSNFDYVSAAQETYSVYRLFNGPKASEFKNRIYENIETEDLVILFDFFYRPEMNLVD
ncbi:MAG: S-layer homology domain-containing protein [Clostridia bacterium]|nr:S-layer homology domain-containing protein [Clostridia bacterium]